MTNLRSGLSNLRGATLLVTATVALACQGDSMMNVKAARGTPVALAQLAPSAWIAVEIGGQTSLATDGGRRRPSLVFRSESEVIGSGGCNDFSGPAKGQGEAVTFGPFAMTRKACPQPIMDQEMRYLKALEAGGRLEQGMDLLFLIGADGQTAVRFEAASRDTGFDDAPL
jgi:heat shock protein HslJ